MKKRIELPANTFVDLGTLRIGYPVRMIIGDKVVTTSDVESYITTSKATQIETLNSVYIIRG